MANHSVNFLLSFSITYWKENVESLNNPFWDETQSFGCFCQLTVKMFFLLLFPNAVISITIKVSIGEWVLFIYSVLSHVNLLECTVFEDIRFPFVPYNNNN